jgi:hypothetical protein
MGPGGQRVGSVKECEGKIVTPAKAGPQRAGAEDVRLRWHDGDHEICRDF